MLRARPAGSCSSRPGTHPRGHRAAGSRSRKHLASGPGCSGVWGQGAREGKAEPALPSQPGPRGRQSKPRAAAGTAGAGCRLPVWPRPRRLLLHHRGHPGAVPARALGLGPVLPAAPSLLPMHPCTASPSLARMQPGWECAGGTGWGCTFVLLPSSQGCQAEPAQPCCRPGQQLWGSGPTASQQCWGQAAWIQGQGRLGRRLGQHLALGRSTGASAAMVQAGHRPQTAAKSPRPGPTSHVLPAGARACSYLPGPAGIFLGVQA